MTDDYPTYLAVEVKLHGGGDLNQELPRAQHKGRVRVADARGELAKGAGVAGVRVRAEQHLARAGVALLREGDVADALVVRVGLELGAVLDVVEIPV